MSLLLPGFAGADGGAIGPRPKSSTYSKVNYDYVKEHKQQGFINYENGLEKLVLGVDFQDAPDGTIWFFPVPASPEDVQIDVLAELPYLRGKNLQESAQKSWKKIGSWSFSSQLYTLLPLMIDSRLSRGLTEFSNSTSGMGFGSGGSSDQSATSDVVVYEHLEKEGIITEVITSKTAEGIYDYFTEKGLEVETGSIPALDNYIGQDFTFIVSWLGGGTDGSIELNLGEPVPDNYYPSSMSPKGISEDLKGVYVKFPTDKIYFPLILTSVYGDDVIPISIKVLGFVTPEIFSEINPFTNVEYFTESSGGSKLTETADFFGSDVSLDSSFNYTKIEILTKSNNFVEDLWMLDWPPFSVRIQNLVVSVPWFVGLVFFLALSALISLIFGMLTFPGERNRKGVKKFLLIGLTNVFTILGVLVTILVVKLRLSPGTQEESNMGVGRRFLFLFFFSVLFVIVLLLLHPRIAENITDYL